MFCIKWDESHLSPYVHTYTAQSYTYTYILLCFGSAEAYYMGHILVCIKDIYLVRVYTYVLAEVLCKQSVASYFPN